MKRLAVGSGLALALALVACRALVGIEELQEDRQPPGAPPVDSGSDTGQQNGGPPDPSTACVQDSGVGQCQPCCKQMFVAFASTFERGPGAQCVCSKLDSECATRCASTTCRSSGGPTPSPDPGCANCVDTFFGEPGESSCQTSCAGSRECELGIACIQGCKAAGR